MSYPTESYTLCSFCSNLWFFQGCYNIMLYLSPTFGTHKFTPLLLGFMTLSLFYLTMYDVWKYTNIPLWYPPPNPRKGMNQSCVCTFIGTYVPYLCYLPLNHMLKMTWYGWLCDSVSVIIICMSFLVRGTRLVNLV